MTTRPYADFPTEQLEHDNRADAELLAERRKMQRSFRSDAHTALDEYVAGIPERIKTIYRDAIGEMGGLASAGRTGVLDTLPVRQTR